MQAIDTSTAKPSASRILVDQVRDFHLTGTPLEIPDPLEGQPLKPIGLASTDVTAGGFPLCYEASGHARFRPLGKLLDDVLGAGGHPLLEGFGPAIAAAAGDWIGKNDRADAGVAEALEAVFADIGRLTELADADEAALRAEGQRLLSVLPRSLRLLGASDASAVMLQVRTLLDNRAPARADFTSRVRTLVQQMEGLLGRGGEPEQAGELAGGLGPRANKFLNPGALAHSLQRTPGHHALEGGRRERVAGAAGILRAFLDASSSEPVITLVCGPDAPTDLALPGVAHAEAAGPCHAALQRTREQMDWFSEVLRAMRVASLEAEHEYRPELHDRAVAHFDWRAATRDEALAAPLFIAVDSLRALATEGLGSVCQALASGLPVQVLALQDAGAGSWCGAADGVDARLPDLGLLAMAFGEAFVLAAPLAAPNVLLEVMGRMSRHIGPGLAVVAAPASGHPTGGLAAAHQAWQARMTPALRYDPDAGDSLSSRFSLDGNPEQEASLERPTAAHVAAVDSAGRGCFAVLPADAWSEGQIPLAEYLARPVAEAQAAVPYILVEGPGGKPLRAVVTRQLARRCREVQRTWGHYQELCGGNRLANLPGAGGRGGDEAPDRRDADERLAQAARRAGAEAAVYRIIAALAGGEQMVAPLGGTAPVPAAPTPGPAAGEITDSAAGTAETAAATATAPSGPYVESALCTSCNECINRYPKIFQYNDSQQAYIADPKAGSYQQLLKAAAACPAQCIHPGPAPD